jgi:hypothetical protein
MKTTKIKICGDLRAFFKDDRAQIWDNQVKLPLLEKSVLTISSQECQKVEAQSSKHVDEPVLVVNAA